MVGSLDYRLNEEYQRNLGYHISVEELPFFYLVCIGFAAHSSEEKYKVLVALAALTLLIFWYLKGEAVKQVMSVYKELLPISAVIIATLFEYEALTPFILFLSFFYIYKGFIDGFSFLYIYRRYWVEALIVEIAFSLNIMFFLSVTLICHSFQSIPLEWVLGITFLSLIGWGRSEGIKIPSGKDLVILDKLLL